MSAMLYHQCAQQLPGISPLDYYLARRLAAYFDEPEKGVFFHIILALSHFQGQGHSCLPLHAIAKQRLWDVSLDETDSPASNEGPVETRAHWGYTFPESDVLKRTIQQALSRRPGAPGAQPLVLEGDQLYLRRYWRYETEVAERLRGRMEFFPLAETRLNSVRTLLDTCYPPGLSLEQSSSRIAVANALGRKFTIITGGPGTGKTYTATRLLLTMLALEPDLRIFMAAPTGKAAQRLNESIVQGKAELMTRGVDRTLLDAIPEDAKTVHRLLGYRPDQVQPKYHEGRPLSCDVLLLDEVSMIDLPMLCRILRALPDSVRIIMLGDANQLPSVEIGNILAELAGTPHHLLRPEAARQVLALTGFQLDEAEGVSGDHVAWLTRSWRFSGEISELARSVHSGDEAGSWQYLTARPADRGNEDETRQVTWVGPAANFDQWLTEVTEGYYLPVLQAENLSQAFARLSAFRLLTPHRVGRRGVEALNRQVEGILSRHVLAVRPGKHYHGQPVMVTENHYGVRLFNGDIGIIWEQSPGVLAAWFEAGQDSDGKMRYRPVRLARLPQVEPVYAMTIHKTQGSEFGHVALVLPEGDSPLLSRQLLYTGITRARDHVTVYTDEPVWKSGVKRQAVRYSGLAQRLRLPE